MFTGIIKALGSVLKTDKSENELKLWISLPSTWGKVKKGDSIAVNGVCLTVAKLKNKEVFFFCQKETMELTNLTYLKPKDKVNLESAMKMSDELGGHIVQGHVDATSKVSKIETIGEGWRYWITLPKKHLKGIVLKGSISLDGISLTVSRLNKKALSVDIIPFTYENTNIQIWKTGYIVNIETDIIGKYVESYMEAMKK